MQLSGPALFCWFCRDPDINYHVQAKIKKPACAGFFILLCFTQLLANSCLSIHTENRTAPIAVPTAQIVAIIAIFFSRVTRLNTRTNQTNFIVAQFVTQARAFH